MATALTKQQKAELASGGALIVELPNLKTQPKRTYWTKYGERLAGLPGDAWSLEHYVLKGFLLAPPAHPEIRETPEIIGADDWDGISKENVEFEEMRAPAHPTATYYLPDGTPVPGLPADPQSILDYGDLGMYLSPAIAASAAANPAQTPAGAGYYEDETA